MPKVSVILPVYNHLKYLKNAIDSVINQTYNDFELLIINDGSSNDPAQITNEYLEKDKRVKYYIKKHTGLAETLNFGLAKAKCKYIARIDADDVWVPEKISMQLQMLKNDDQLFLLGSSIFFINENDNEIDNMQGFNNGKPLKHDQLVRKMLRNNVICSSGLIYRSEVHEYIGWYDLSFETSMDYDFLIRALSHFKGLVMEEKLVKYRVTNKMLTIRKRDKMISESTRIRIRALSLLNASFTDRLRVCLDIGGLNLWKLRKRFFN